MKNNQARLLFRILAAPVAGLAWLVALLLLFQAIAAGDFKRIVGGLLVCLLALLFTFVAVKGDVPRWLYFIFTWGERP
jgi:hypothetical protein